MSSGAAPSSEPVRTLAIARGGETVFDAKPLVLQDKMDKTAEFNTMIKFIENPACTQLAIQTGVRHSYPNAAPRCLPSPSACVSAS